MHAFVPGLVDAVLELFAAQLAGGDGQLDVDGAVDGQGRQVRDVLEILRVITIPTLRVAVFQLDDFQVASGGHELRQANAFSLHHKRFQVLVAPNKMSEPRLLSLVGQRAGRTAGVVRVQAIGQPLSQMEIDEMSAQIQTSEIPIVANSTLGKLFVLDLLSHGVGQLRGGCSSNCCRTSACAPSSCCRRGSGGRFQSLINWGRGILSDN